jgi:hypothetical protein
MPRRTPRNSRGPSSSPHNRSNTGAAPQWGRCNYRPRSWLRSCKPDRTRRSCLGRSGNPRIRLNKSPAPCCRRTSRFRRWLRSDTCWRTQRPSSAVEEQRRRTRRSTLLHQSNCRNHSLRPAGSRQHPKRSGRRPLPPPRHWPRPLFRRSHRSRRFPMRRRWHGTRRSPKRSRRPKQRARAQSRTSRLAKTSFTSALPLRVPLRTHHAAALALPKVLNDVHGPDQPPPP